MAKISDFINEEEVNKLSPIEKINKQKELFGKAFELNDTFANTFVKLSKDEQQAVFDDFKGNLAKKHPSLGNFEVKEVAEKVRMGSMMGGMPRTPKMIKETKPLYDLQTEQILEALETGVIEPSDLPPQANVALLGITDQRNYKSSSKIRDNLVKFLGEEYGIEEKFLRGGRAKIGAFLEGIIPSGLEINNEKLVEFYKGEEGVKFLEKAQKDKEKIEAIEEAINPSKKTLETFGALAGVLAGGVAAGRSLSAKGLDIIRKTPTGGKINWKGLGAQAATEFGLGAAYAKELPSTEMTTATINKISELLGSDVRVDEDNRIVTGLEAMAIGTAIGGLIEGVGAAKFALKVKEAKSSDEIRKVFKEQLGVETPEEFNALIEVAAEESLDVKNKTTFERAIQKKINRGGFDKVETQDLDAFERTLIEQKNKKKREGEDFTSEDIILDDFKAYKEERLAREATQGTTEEVAEEVVDEVSEEVVGEVDEAIAPIAKTEEPPPIEDTPIEQTPAESVPTQPLKQVESDQVDDIVDDAPTAEPTPVVTPETPSVSAVGRVDAEPVAQDIQPTPRAEEPDATIKPEEPATQTQPIRQTDEAIEQLNDVSEVVEEPVAKDVVKEQSDALQAQKNLSEKKAEEATQQPPETSGANRSDKFIPETLARKTDFDFKGYDETPEATRQARAENVPIKDANKIFNENYLDSLDPATREAVIQSSRELIGVGGVDKLSTSLTREDIVSIAKEMGIDDAEKYVGTAKDMATKTPAAMIAMRNAVDQINVTIGVKEQQLKQALASQDKKLVDVLSGEIYSLQQRQTKLVGDMLNMRSAAGRQLAHFRWYTYRYDDLEWLVSQAKKQMGFPSGAALPDEVVGNLQQLRKEVRDAKRQASQDNYKTMSAEFKLPSISRSISDVKNRVTSEGVKDIASTKTKVRQHKLSNEEKQIEKVAKGLNRKAGEVNEAALVNAIANTISKGKSNTITKLYRESVANNFINKLKSTDDGDRLPPAIKLLYDAIQTTLNNQLLARTNKTITKQSAIDKIENILRNPEKNKDVIDRVKLQIENIEIPASERERLRAMLDFLASGNVDPGLINSALKEGMGDIAKDAGINVKKLIMGGDDDLILGRLKENLMSRLEMELVDADDFMKEVEGVYSEIVNKWRELELARKAQKATQRTVSQFSELSKLIGDASDKVKKDLINDEVNTAIKEINEELGTTTVKEVKEGRHLELVTDVVNRIRAKSGLPGAEFNNIEEAIRLKVQEIVDNISRKQAEALKTRLEKSLKQKTKQVNDKIKKLGLRQLLAQRSSNIADRYRNSLVASITGRLKNNTTQSPALQQLFKAIQSNARDITKVAIKESREEIDPALLIGDILNNLDENEELLRRTRDSILDSNDINDVVKRDAAMMIDVMLKNPLGEDLLNRAVKNELKEAFEGAETTFINEIKAGNANETLEQVKESFAQKTGLTGQDLDTANKAIDQAFNRLLLKERADFIKNKIRDNKNVGAKLKKNWLQKLDEVINLGVLEDPRAGDVLEKVFRLEPYQADELKLLLEQSKTLTEKHDAVRKYLRELGATTMFEAVATTSKAFMLGGVKILLRNILSPLENFIVKEGLESPFVAISDTALSRITGRKTFYASYGSILKDVHKAMPKALSDAKTVLKGLDPDALEKFNVAGEMYFKNMGKAGTAFTGAINGLFRAMAAGDRVVRRVATQRILRNMAEVKFRREGLKDADLKKAVDDFIANPPPEFLAEALFESEYITFTNKLKPVDMFSNMIKQGYRSDNAYAVLASAMADNLIPFRRTPANILLRYLEYIPGLDQMVQSASAILKTKKAQYLPIESAEKLRDEAQRGLARSFARLGTGASLVTLGGYLYNEGLIVPMFDKDDYGMNNTLAVAGLQPGTFMGIPLTGLGPGTWLLLVGAGWKHELGKIKDPTKPNYPFLDNLGAAAKPFKEMLLENPFFSGIKDLDKSLSGSKGIADTAANFISRLVPAFSKEIADIIDPTMRQAKSSSEDIVEYSKEVIKEQLFRKIPVLKSTVPEKLDASGVPVKLDSAWSAILPFVRQYEKRDNLAPTMSWLIENRVGLPTLRPKPNESDELYQARQVATGWIKITVAEGMRKSFERRGIDKLKASLEAEYGSYEFGMNKIIEAELSSAQSKITNALSEAVDLPIEKQIEVIERFSERFTKTTIERIEKISKDTEQQLLKDYLKLAGHKSFKEAAEKLLEENKQ